MLAVRLFLSSAGKPIEHLRKWSVAVCLLFGLLTLLTMLLLKWHSIDMHVKLVSCFALCWKLPLWTISLELDTQSNRFGIMWHSTMILRILPFGVIEWGNIRHIGSQETFNSTRSPPPAEISVQHIAATITQFLQRFKAWNWVCSSRTRHYRNFDTPKNCPPHCFGY